MVRDYRARNPKGGGAMFTPFHSSRISRNAVLVDDMAPWSRVMSCWFAVGCAAMICIPALRGYDPLVGWLPFWLVVAPAIDLAVLHRRSLIAVAHDLLARVNRRRRTARQAKPLRRRARTIRRTVVSPPARKWRPRMAAT
jgi:hypothetical protein